MVKSRDIEGLLDEYWEVLQRSPLSNASVADYWYFAECFVRWARGEFEPGARVYDESRRMPSST